MPAATSLAPEDILAIPLNKPTRLFSSDAATMKREYRALVRRWHPDVNASPQAGEVLRHINALHAAARGGDAGSDKDRPGQLDLATTAGTRIRLRYRHQTADDLGTVYIARAAVTWLSDPANADLLDAAATRVEALPLTDAAMRAEMARFLPGVQRRFDTDDRAGLTLSMRPDLVRLSDVLDQQGGQIEQAHLGWIISGALNIACYLHWAGLTHNALLPENLFVGLRDHAVALIGGWPYAAPVGARLTALPAAAYRLAPPAVRDNRTADNRLDLELIKHTGRVLLGDPAGTTLATDDRLSPALVNWLRLPAGNDPVAAYRAWHTALETAYGRRRFVTFPADPDDIYPRP